MSLSDIFQKPKHIKGIGDVYPVKLVDWEEFEDNLNILMLSEKNFGDIESEYVLDLLIFGIGDPTVIDMLVKVFKIILRKEDIHFSSIETSYAFIVDENHAITKQNYDEFRQIVLRQNLLFEPKVYKDPLMQEWANKVLETRNKNALDVTLEDMVSTVASLNGKHYWELEKYTTYQIRQEFQRILKYSDYNSRMMSLANPYMDHSKMSNEHFAENIDMFKNPYDDLFKSKDKLSNINKAINN